MSEQSSATERRSTRTLRLIEESMKRKEEIDKQRPRITEEHLKDISIRIYKKFRDEDKLYLLTEDQLVKTCQNVCQKLVDRLIENKVLEKVSENN